MMYRIVIVYLCYELRSRRTQEIFSDFQKLLKNHIKMYKFKLLHNCY
jgi:hypothetical protein